jgi:hypothetical protein
MNLHRLDKTLDKYQSILGSNNITGDITPDPETQQAKAFLDQRRELYYKAYKKHMDNWFAAHPNSQYFEETYDEFVRDCEFDEWVWHLIQRLQDTPEQRYQQAKSSPLEHEGSWYMRNLEGYDNEGCNQFTGCVSTCRFYPMEGRIEDIEVIEDYRNYQHFDELYNAWLEDTQQK